MFHLPNPTLTTEHTSLNESLNVWFRLPVEVRRGWLQGTWER